MTKCFTQSYKCPVFQACYVYVSQTNEDMTRLMRHLEQRYGCLLKIKQLECASLCTLFSSVYRDTPTGREIATEKISVAFFPFDEKNIFAHMLRNILIKCIGYDGTTTAHILYTCGYACSTSLTILLLFQSIYGMA